MHEREKFPFTLYLGLVFYKCGDDVAIERFERSSYFEKNLVLNGTLALNSNMEAALNTTQILFDNEDVNER